MYQALYRKYRPKHFRDVAGQQAIVKTLKNALVTNKMSHAYLFAGPRGTGKTTMAKILARTINCISPIEGESCDNCKNCIQSSMKECVDIVEIDAASNNGVDEIRELKNKINLVPSALKFKVYIIDEVHMLSIGAFNALLKTLEEPPNHVIFILATTDVQKVPITILSRCQCFFFKKLKIDDIRKKLSEIAKNENISIDDDVLTEIAISSDGGMRDAIGNLDKLNSYTNDKITISDFQELNGIISYDTLERFISDISEGNIKSILNTIQMFDSSGKDFIQIVNQLLQYLRKQLIDHYIEQKVLKISEQEMLNFLRMLNEMVIKLKNTENTRLLLEIELIEFIKKRDQIISREIIDQEKETLQKNNITERQEIKSDINMHKLENTATIDNNHQEQSLKLESFEKTNHHYKQLLDIRINNTFAKAAKDRLLEIKNKWSLLNEYIFDPKIGYLICNILDGTLRVASEENLIISYEYESMVDKAIQHYDELVNQISSILNIRSNLVFITDNQWENLRKEFIEKKEKNIPYTYIEEPILSIEEDDVVEEKSNKVKDSYQTAVDLFGDIVEIE